MAHHSNARNLDDPIVSDERINNGIYEAGSNDQADFSANNVHCSAASIRIGRRCSAPPLARPYSSYRQHRRHRRPRTSQSARKDEPIIDWAGQIYEALVQQDCGPQSPGISWHGILINDTKGYKTKSGKFPHDWVDKADSENGDGEQRPRFARRGHGFCSECRRLKHFRVSWRQPISLRRGCACRRCNMRIPSQVERCFSVHHIEHVMDAITRADGNLFLAAQFLAQSSPAGHGTDIDATTPQPTQAVNGRDDLTGGAPGFSRQEYLDGLRAARSQDLSSRFLRHAATSTLSPAVTQLTAGVLDLLQNCPAPQIRELCIRALSQLGRLQNTAHFALEIELPDPEHVELVVLLRATHLVAELLNHEFLYPVMREDSQATRMWSAAWWRVSDMILEEGRRLGMPEYQ